MSYSDREVQKIMPVNEVINNIKGIQNIDQNIFNIGYKYQDE